MHCKNAVWKELSLSSQLGIMCPSSALLAGELGERGMVMRAVLRCTKQKAHFQCPLENVQVIKSRSGSLKGE